MIYRWYVDLRNTAQLRSAHVYVHVLPLCLPRAQSSENNQSLEEIHNRIAIGK